MEQSTIVRKKQVWTRATRLSIQLFVCIAMLCLGVTTASAADPQSNSSDQAVWLNGKLSGRLEAGGGGNFAYYKFNYFGGDKDVIVKAQITPNDQTVLTTAGINVYGPVSKKLYITNAQRWGHSPNVSERLYATDKNAAGVYTIQVFNYSPSAPIDFQIWAEGLTPQPSNSPESALPAAVPVPAPALIAPSVAVPAVIVPPASSFGAPSAPPVAPAPTTAAPPVAPAPVAVEPTPAGDNSIPERARTLTASQGVSIPGGSGGHFAYYKFSYPGAWPVKLELDPGTTDVLFLKNAGFKVYGPEPGKEYLTNKFDWNERLWLGTADFWTNDKGTFLIQVYNYNPHAEPFFNFTLRVTGLPPQAVVATPVPIGATASLAQPISQAPAAAVSNAGSTATSASATLGGGTGGQFHYYSFDYPGEVEGTIDLRVGVTDQNTLKNIGYIVYGPVEGREYLKGSPSPESPSRLTGKLWTKEKGTFVIQVFNYNPSPDTTVPYTIQITGLPDRSGFGSR